VRVVDVEVSVGCAEARVAAYRESLYGGLAYSHSRRQRRRWKPVKTVKVTWVGKLRVYRDRTYGSALWWLRCDACLREFKSAFTLTFTHVDALDAARRHALTVHEVKL
jgi:hypothetical protein